MKLKLSVLPIIIVVSLALIHGFALAQDRGITDLSDDPVEDLIDTWRERVETISLGKDTLGLENLELIKKKMAIYGIRNAPQIAVALIDEVVDRKSELSMKDRITLLRISRDLAPDIASLNLKLSGYFLSFSYFSLKDGISLLSSGLSSYLSGIETRFRFIANILYWSFIAFCFTALIFFLVLTLKYFHALLHMVGHMLPKTFSKMSTVIILILIPVVFLLTLGPLSLIFVPTVYYWLLSNGNEKAVMSSFIVALIFIPHIFYFTAYPYRYQRSVEKKILSVDFSPDHRNNIEIIKKIVKNNPDDTEAKITLALLYKRLGKYIQAKSILDKLLARNPNNPKALVNLGNIQYIRGKLTNAISSYSKALAIDSNSFLASYNLGKVLYAETRIEEADQALKKASLLDSKKFKAYESISNPKNPLAYVVDEKIERKDLESRIAALKKPSVEFRNKIWSKNKMLNTSPFGSSLAGIIVFIILIILSRLKKLIDPPRVCEICGTAFCKKCSRLSEHRDICSPCHFIFIRKETLEPTFKVKKEAEERRHRIFQNIFKNWTSFALPGFGHIYCGKAIVGIICVFTFTLMVSWICLPKGLIEDPFTTMLKGTRVFLVLALIAASIAYLFVNLTIRKVK